MRADRQPIARPRLLEISQPRCRGRRRRPALRGRARHRARRSQPRAETPRPVVPGRYLDRLPRHHRRHGGQQFLRRPLFALRQYAGECAVGRCDPGRRGDGAFRYGQPRPFRFAERLAVARHRPRSARYRQTRARRDRNALSESAAPCRRLQSRFVSAGKERTQSRAYPDRLGRHARLLDQDRIEVVAFARPPRGRRLPFRQLLRGDECRAASRETRADCGRAGRSHHDRARARDRDVPPDARAIRARHAGRDAAGRVRRRRSERESAAAEDAARD